MKSKEIELIELKKVEKLERTKTWGSPQDDDNKTRCWGPCPPPAPEEEPQELEVLEIA